MTQPRHLTADELQTGLDYILAAPKDEGTLELLVRRPEIGVREVLSEGELDLDAGLVGDNWKARGSGATEDGSAHPEMQLNVMGARVVDLVAQDAERRPLAGDQLYLDLDLSQNNLPAGTRLQIGEAVIEVTEPPHTGCAKFVERFGLEAMKFVNSGRGKELRLRGLNAKVVEPGKIRVGDRARKV